MSTVTAFKQEAPERPRSEVTASPRLASAIAEALADEFSTRIISSSILEGKSIDEICAQEIVPQSTCYRRMKHLVDEGVMVVERIVLLPEGKKRVVYRSAFSRVSVKLENGVLSARVAVNPDVADKLQRARLAVRWNDYSDSQPEYLLFEQEHPLVELERMEGIPAACNP